MGHVGRRPDGLTKPKAELLDEMREWLRGPRVTLVEDAVSNKEYSSVKVEHVSA